MWKNVPLIYQISYLKHKVTFLMANNFFIAHFRKKDYLELYMYVVYQTTTITKNNDNN